MSDTQYNVMMAGLHYSNTISELKDMYDKGQLPTTEFKSILSQISEDALKEMSQLEES